jgi:hypothetical protein
VELIIHDRYQRLATRTSDNSVYSLNSKTTDNSVYSLNSKTTVRILLESENDLLGNQSAN